MGVSQWSLTFEVRKRGIPKMQAILVDKSQWSLTFEVRKRMIFGMNIICLFMCRNGA